MDGIDLDAFFGELSRRLDVPLDGLRAVVELRRTLDRIESLLAADARAAGWSWAEIGEALGISRQSALSRHRLAVRRAGGDSPRPPA